MHRKSLLQAEMAYNLEYVAARIVDAIAAPGQGLLLFRVLSFAVQLAEATFGRLLDQVFESELEPYAFAYLEDIVIAKPSQIPQQGIPSPKKGNLRMNFDKCKFCVEFLTYLSHVINKDGIYTDSEKIRAITDLTVLTNRRALCRFLGVITWYRSVMESSSAGSVTPQSTIFYKCHPKMKVKIVICIVCEEAYHVSDFAKLNGAVKISGVLGLCPEHNLGDITSKVDPNLLTNGAKTIIAQIKLAYTETTLNPQSLSTCR
ncbi:hypothetical protein TSAR_015089 [Trichomalopsis sarcophagae]|uniref:Reverse transcriptase domain-containing protein n=1 Tax=Trichomalopsis sarcophagae TaxID=543379 RepID=A0A232FA48_9HYME|nr:hypothetical protein TSAR_015089 [Trichomalopsis sarcophagae]